MDDQMEGGYGAIPEIGKICYVGAGTMGCYNALVAAVAGYEAVLFDASTEALSGVPNRQRDIARMLVGGGLCTEAEVTSAMARVSTCDDLATAVRGAHLISESVFERLQLKREIYTQLQQLADSSALITTNSSTLQVSDILDDRAGGERFAALHSHLGSPLVDIVPAAQMPAASVKLLQRYVRSVGGEPLVLRKEHPGYVLNAMLGPLLGTSLAMLLQGESDIESLDRAWMNGAGAAMGPFGMMDLFGLSVIYDSWRHGSTEGYREKLQQPVLALLDSYIGRGAQGMKSGEGFYRYPVAGYQQPEFQVAQPGDDKLFLALVSVVIGNALVIAERGVASPADIDRAWRVGTYLAQGPFELLVSLGTEQTALALSAHLDAGRISGALVDEAMSCIESYRSEE